MTFAATLDVSLPAVRRSANAMLLGQGIEPQNQANNLLFSGSEMLWNEGALAPARALRIPIVRWPNGTPADEFEWEKAIGPLSNRQLIPHTGSSFLGTFGPDEVSNFCSMHGADLVFTANLYTRGAADMMAHLAYLRSKRIGKRGSQRIIVELSNEPYLDGPTGITNIPVQTFVNHVIEFGLAIRSSYPDIEIAIPYRSGVDPAGLIWVNEANFSEDMLDLLAAANFRVDYWALHNGYLPDSYANFASDADFMSAMMASPLVHTLDMATTIANITRYPIYSNSKFCMTEWHGGHDPVDELHALTMAAAVQDADMFREMMFGKLDFATFHNLISGNAGIYNYSSSTRVRAPHWWLFSWLKQLFVGECLSVSSSVSPLQTIVANSGTPGRAGRVPAGLQFPSIAGYGTIRDTQAQMIIVNKSQTEDSNVTINCNGTNKRGGIMLTMRATSNPFDTAANETKLTFAQASLGPTNPFVVNVPAMSVNYLKFNFGIGAQ